MNVHLHGLLKLLRRRECYAIALVVSVVFLAVFIRSPEPEQPTPAAGPVSAGASATFSLAETSDFSSSLPPELFVPPEEIDAAPAVKLKSYARKIQVQIVDSDDLSLNKMASELLDLNPLQVEQVNNSLKDLWGAFAA